MPLKGLDVIVCLKLALRDGGGWSYRPLAESLGLSTGETNYSVKRLLAARLLMSPPDGEGKPLPRTAALLEFLEHGVRYAFYPELGRIGRGLPTAFSASPLREALQVSDEERVVWPDPEGTARGQALEPLHPTALVAARNDSQLYRALALVDAIRIGRTRERKVALEHLTALVESTDGAGHQS